MYFLDAFRAAFPSIALLVGETIDPTEAWGYVSQMLGKQPESSSTQALEGSVGQLLPHLDTASLRAAPAQERVAEMQKLVRQMNADTGSDKGLSRQVTRQPVRRPFQLSTQQRGRGSCSSLP